MKLGIPLLVRDYMEVSGYITCLAVRRLLLCLCVGKLALQAIKDKLGQKSRKSSMLSLNRYICF